MIPEDWKNWTPYETVEDESGKERKSAKKREGRSSGEPKGRELTEEVDTRSLLSDLKEDSDESSEGDSEEEGRRESWSA